MVGSAWTAQVEAPVCGRKMIEHPTCFARFASCRSLTETEECRMRKMAGTTRMPDPS